MNGKKESSNGNASSVSLPVIGLIMVTASALYTGFSWWQSEVASVQRTVDTHASLAGHPEVLAMVAALQKEVTALHEKIAASEKANLLQHEEVSRRLIILDREVEKIATEEEKESSTIARLSETLRLFELYHPQVRERMQGKEYGQPSTDGAVR